MATTTHYLKDFTPDDVRGARIALAQASNGIGMALAMAAHSLEKAKSAVDTINAMFNSANDSIIWEGAEDEQTFTESVYGAEEYARIVQALDQLSAGAHDAIHTIAEPLGRLVESCKATPDDGCELWLRAAGRASMADVRESA